MSAETPAPTPARKPLLSLDEALERLLSTVQPLGETETLSTFDALGRVLHHGPVARKVGGQGFGCLKRLAHGDGYSLSSRYRAASSRSPRPAATARAKVSRAAAPSGPSKPAARAASMASRVSLPSSVTWARGA